MMQPLVLIAASVLFQAPATSPKGDAPKVHKIAVGGEGGWDYVSVDAEGRRLYISRGNKVVVVDLDKETVVGEVADTPGVHGIAVAPELNKGFTTNGSDATVTVFDTKTLKATGRIKASGMPDAILYDSVSGRVFTFNHRTDDTTAIDASAGTVAGTLALGGEPEGAVADGKGHIFVNIRSSSEVVEFDAKALKVLNRWPLAPGTRPTGLAMDTEHRRLFSACGNGKMVIMDADKGTVLGTADIGRGTDGAAFDPSKGLAYSSNGGDGTVTVVGEVKAEPGKFAAVATIPTQASARTMTIDPKTHRLYLPAATADTTPAPAPNPATKAATKGGGRGRRMVPNSFVIVVIGD